MYRLLVAAVAGVFTIVIAQMASAQPAPLPQLYSWTGWYVGLNAGGTWGGSNSVDTVSSPIQSFTFAGPPPVGPFTAQSAAGATGNAPVGDSAFIGGGQIGFNWQFARVWIAGFEADIQGIANGKHDGTLNTSSGPFTFFAIPGEVISTQIRSSKRLEYLGTIRGRLGYLATPALLLYATGGLAYGGVKASTLISQSDNDCTISPGNCVQTSASTAGSFSGTRAGWTAGAGIEWKFWQHWSAKLEYLYYDLGSVTFNNGPLTFGTGSTVLVGSSVVASQSTTKFDGNIVRVGVNYSF